MEQIGYSSIDKIREVIHSRPRREGETSVDRVRISHRLHSIGDRVVVRQFDPDLLFVGTIVDIYYIGSFDFRVIVERRCGCNISFYRTTVQHLHQSEVISNYVR